MPGPTDTAVIRLSASPRVKTIRAQVVHVRATAMAMATEAAVGTGVGTILSLFSSGLFGPPLRVEGHTCPSCLGGAVQRIRRQGVLERLILAALRCRPYRCIACECKFYDRPLNRPR